MKYICFRCGKQFGVDLELETDKPTCLKCFKKLIKTDTSQAYFYFIGQKGRND